MNTNLQTNRMCSLDVLKCVAAFFVVYIHTTYPDTVGYAIKAFARFAVPAFFMITGYFYPHLVEKGRTSRYLRKIIIYAIGFSMLYLFPALAISVKQHQLSEFIGTLTSWPVWRDFLVLNAMKFGTHLWYFWALIYALIIIRLFDYLKMRHTLYVISSLLLLGNVYFELRDDAVLLNLNFLFLALPYICLGRMIRERQASRHLLGVSDASLLLLSLLGIVGIFFEFIGIEPSTCDVDKAHLFFIPIFIVPLFIWLVRHPSFGQGTWFATNGCRYSAYIYIFHLLISYVTDHFWLNAHWYMLTRTIIVWAITTLLVASYFCLKDRIKIK